MTELLRPSAPSVLLGAAYTPARPSPWGALGAWLRLIWERLSDGLWEAEVRARKRGIVSYSDGVDAGSSAAPRKT